MTEAELVAAARSGDRDSIRRLYDRYAPRVFAVVRRIAGEDELARDCAQEAWMRAIRSLSSFRGNARFSTWLHRIAVNVTLESLRGVEARERRQVPFPPSLAAGAEHGDVLLAGRLEAALSQIPGGMREVLILHDVERYTHGEIGDMLGITAGTSKSQLFKARARMKALLAPCLCPDKHRHGPDGSTHTRATTTIPSPQVAPSDRDGTDTDRHCEGVES